jgi:CRP/FNR family transcriptional regulator, cyclic AMP receptor protein
MPALSLPHATIVDLLDGLDLFTSLSDEEVDSLARKVDTVTWEAGTLVFSEGDPGDSCYVIHSGQVKLVRRLADGQPIALALVGLGGIVGELALFAGGRRSATMQAIEQTEAVAISREDLMGILRGNADAAVSMAVHVA